MEIVQIVMLANTLLTNGDREPPCLEHLPGFNFQRATRPECGFFSSSEVILNLSILMFDKCEVDVWHFFLFLRRCLFTTLKLRNIILKDVFILPALKRVWPCDFASQLQSCWV